jgi:hypothetical protein
MMSAASLAHLVMASLGTHPDLALYLHRASYDPSLQPVVMFVCGVGFTVAGVNAYSGRWRGWAVKRYFTFVLYPAGQSWALGLALMGPGLLLVQVAALLPKPAGRPLGVLAIVLLLLGGIGLFYVPRPLLPRWYRAVKGLDRGPLRVSGREETSDQWLQRIDALTARGDALIVSHAVGAGIVGRCAEPCGGAFIGAFIGGTMASDRASSWGDHVRARCSDMLVRGFGRDSTRAPHPGGAA